MSSTHSQLITGRKSAIGTSQVQMVSDTALRAEGGVQILADPDNSGVVYVGRTGLTANSSDSTDGFPLRAGDSILIPVRQPHLIYLKGSASGQKVWFIIL